MMVYCEGGCEDWYHCSCVGIDEEDAKELLDRFICPKCTIPDQAYTTFKPMCRYHNVGVFLGKPACRKAAQATKDPPSKYCSLEHGLAWARFILKALHPDSDLPAIPGGNLTPANLRAILGESLTKFQALGEKPRVTKEADDEKGDDEKGGLYFRIVPINLMANIAQTVRRTSIFSSLRRRKNSRTSRTRGSTLSAGSKATRTSSSFSK